MMDRVERGEWRVQFSITPGRISSTIMRMTSGLECTGVDKNHTSHLIQEMIGFFSGGSRSQLQLTL